MQKHPYRALIIWGVILVSLLNIYPTIGWMLTGDDERWLALSDEDRTAIVQDETRAAELPAGGTRQARLLRWQQEDDARARAEQGYFSQLWQGAKRWAEFDRDKVITLGLDLQGGVHMVMGFDYRDLPAEKLAAYENDNLDPEDIQARLQQTLLQQIRRRVNDFEAREPIIQALGKNQIQVQLPGERDVQRAIRLIKKTALLNFNIVAGMDETVAVFEKIKRKYPQEFTPFIIRPYRTGDPFKVAAKDFTRVAKVLERASSDASVVPEDKMLAFSQPPKPYAAQEYRLYLLDKTPIQSGEGLTSAVAVPNVARWKIDFTLDPRSGINFAKATEENMGRAMAIVLDGVVVSAPTIQGVISTNGEITGDFSGEEANDLAIALDSGSMAVPMREDYTGVVGASLGADSVEKGVISAMVGIALVGVFMLVYYHAAGVMALIALGMNAVMVVAAMAYFDMTLTLPGIAGLILTVGMAVDANVLIFERIREELRLGHSLLSSIDNGFKRATITILDANVTTLIAAAVLLQFGTGPIEGFAITLSIGVCSSVFTALIVSRALFDFLVRSKVITKLTMFSLVPHDTKIPFLEARKLAAASSVALILLGAGMFVYHGSDNFGVDFTHGTNATVTLNSQRGAAVGELREALASAGFDSPIVMETGLGQGGNGNSFLIRVGETEAGVDEAGENVDTVATRIQSALATLADNGAAGVSLDEVLTVGPAVGKQLRLDALYSIFFSLFFIVLYVTFRFEWRFAAGAVAALAHDVLITLGIFAILGRQITMPVVAAVLTIIGYSLNDTIVVFDRIRGDIVLYRGKNTKFIDILNIAINSTLSRTLLTSLTTLFVVVVLFIFGGTAINDFALALIIGVIVGTYSSVFIASPVVYLLHVLQGKHVQPTDTGRGDSTGRYIRSKKGRARQKA